MTLQGTLSQGPEDHARIRRAHEQFLAFSDPDIIHHWEMPHHGEKPTREACMQWAHRGHLHDKDMHSKRYRSDCGTYDCPVCRSIRLPSGAMEPHGYEKRAAIRIRDRFEHYVAGLSLADFPVHPKWSGTKDRHKRAAHAPHVFHVVASPPQAWAKRMTKRLSTMKVLWKHCRQSLQTRGVIGGAIIYHHHRVPGRWNDRIGCSHGPHFHVLGITKWGDAYDADACALLYSGGPVTHSALRARLLETGAVRPKDQAVAGDRWVVRFLQGRHGSKRTPRDIYHTCAYILSHAARPHHVRRPAEPGDYPASPRTTVSGELRRSTPPAGHVVRWFGALSYNKLKVPDVQKCTIYCGVCKQDVAFDEWHRLAWAGPAGMKPPPDHASTPAAWWRLVGLEDDEREQYEAHLRDLGVEPIGDDDP